MLKNEGGCGETSIFSMPRIAKKLSHANIPGEKKEKSFGSLAIFLLSATRCLALELSTIHVEAWDILNPQGSQTRGFLGGGMDIYGELLP